MSPLHYLRVWVASMRYTVTRYLMFRFDFILWSAVEFVWMAVNVLLVSVIFRHTEELAGWSRDQVLLLIGTAMLIQRLFTGLFMSNLFEFGRNIRSGHFDFFLAQPGHPLFMISTRKLDPDGLLNSVAAGALVVYAARQLGLHPTGGELLAYAGLVGCGVVIHYSVMVCIVSLTFWIIKTEGIEGSYFTLFEFARIPRAAFRGISEVVFVYALPAVVVSNVPASALMGELRPASLLWLGAAAAGWFFLAIMLFSTGLRRYTSASS